MALRDWPDLTDSQTIILILVISVVLYLLFKPKNK